MRLRLLLTSLLLLVLPTEAVALDAGPNDLYARVVDVGPGLCVVVKAPGGKHLVFDGGHWTGKHCRDGVRAVVGDAEEIDVMILSHSDADHIGNVPDILGEYRVRQIFRAGEIRPGTTWQNANNAIAEAAKHGATVINFLTMPLAPGTTFPLGDAVLTIVAGWTEWTEPGPTASEKVNALSIVAKLTYRGRSILLTGDTVGRRKDDDDSACKDAEAVMVQRHQTGTVSLKADVVQAPHHGGNNGSATCFIQAVAPTFVIFSAGHQHEHPTRRAAQRYLTNGVRLQNILRTDRSDDEPGTHWQEGRIAGCHDKRGDDDVEVVIRDNGTVEVAYRTPDGGC